MKPTTPDDKLRLTCPACAKLYPDNYSWTPGMVNMLNSLSDEERAAEFADDPPPQPTPAPQPTYAELVAALRPFADYCESIPPETADKAYVGVWFAANHTPPTLTLGDCRRAAALLSGLTATVGGKVQLRTSAQR